MALLAAFARFWYDLVIGDDWKIAVYAVLTLVVVSLLAASGRIADGPVAVGGTALLCVCFVLGVTYDARRTTR